MRMRITGNVWRDGRVLAIGAEVDLPEPECERLAVLGVADPASVPDPKPEPVAVEPSEKPKRRRRK